MDDAVLGQDVQASPQVAVQVQWQLEAFLQPLLVSLDQHLDARLVRTFVHTIGALLQWRNRAHGLLLSELGAYLLTPAHAPAGTKRLSNLLRSMKWAATDIVAYLWQRADARLEELEAGGEEALLIWDSSVLEKPESLASPDLGSVRSSKARRLTRIKPGFYQPPSRPIFVPGWHWLGLLLLGRTGQSGPPEVATMRWWTNRRPQQSDRRAEALDLLVQVARLKLLLMATLAYAFLLSLLRPEHMVLRCWLLRYWCHRTGKRSREASTPLYRLRSALSRLWQTYLPSTNRALLNPG